jgi:hypothetical protein
MLLWARGRDCMLTFVIRSSIIAHRQNVCLDCVGLTRCIHVQPCRRVARGAPLSVLAPAGELKRPPHLPRTRTQQGHCCRRQGAGFLQRLSSGRYNWAPAKNKEEQNSLSSKLPQPRGAGKAYYHTFYHLETPHASCGAHSTVTVTQTGVRMTIYNMLARRQPLQTSTLPMGSNRVDAPGRTCTNHSVDSIPRSVSSSIPISLSPPSNEAVKQ